MIGKFYSTDRNGHSLTFHLGTTNSGLQPSPFFITKEGVLKTRTAIDYETNATEYEIGVVVRDPHGGRADANFNIKLLNIVEDFDLDGEEDHYDLDDDDDGFSDIDELAYGSDPFDSQSVINHAPEDILMEGGEIEENQPVGTVVARFTGVDKDQNDSFSYGLIAPEINEEFPFKLSPVGVLRSEKIFDYEGDEHNYSLSVRVRDEHNTSFEKSFVVSLRNQVEDMDGDGTEDAHDEDRDGDGYSNDQEVKEGTDPDNQYSIIHKPLVETVSGELDENGSMLFSGRVEDNGQGEISDFGFVISSGISMDAKRSKVYWIRGVGTPDEFTLRVENAPFEKVLYFRAWAKNAAGYGIGPVRKMRIPEPPQQWWGEVTEEAGDWKTSSWFGSFISYGDGWLFHESLGWLYSSPDQENSVWLWMTDNGWLWTKESVWPYLWSNQSGGWWYLYPASPGKPTRFYDYSRGEYR